MSKVASYLQEHIAGEVSTDSAIRGALSTDMSVLAITPELIVYPRLTNDIRKVARFAWQLAEKGHVLSITPRGFGSDQTGGAIGSGVLLVTTAHLDHIFEYDSKQKLLRLQPGVPVSTLQSALRLNGAGIPALPTDNVRMTIGGAVAGGATSYLSGRYGGIRRYVHQLEIVLANGDILQTGRINKRELSRRKGLQTFEGEIYRGIDNLIEDNRQLIEETLGKHPDDSAGYASIAEVKRADGSIDLTPLFVGSQGTLGIVSEMILKAEFMSSNHGVAVISFASSEKARDALDKLRALEPAYLEYYDGEIFARAHAAGRRFEFQGASSDSAVEAVVLVGFDGFSERARTHKLKKLDKLVGDDGTVMIGDDKTTDDLLDMREATSFLLRPSGTGESAPPLFDGFFVPPEHFEAFCSDLQKLADKHHVSLPIYGRALDHVYYTRPVLQLRKVGDKQKVFKLLDEFAKLVDTHGGQLIAEGSEGRVKAKFAYQALDDDVLQLYAQVKAIFDPYGLLNPGVKQANELKALVAKLRTDYDTAARADYSPYN